MRPPASSAAFTLIEVVVALGLAALLSVAVQRLVVHAYRTSAMLEQDSAKRAADALPFGLLGQDLNNLPAGGDLTLQGGILTFSTLHALDAERVAARHAVHVEYVIEPASSGRFRLLRRERELDADPPQGNSFSLAESLARASVQVWDGRRWHDAWPPALPQRAVAVRLSLQLPGQDEPRVRVFRLAPFTWRRHDG